MVAVNGSTVPDALDKQEALRGLTSTEVLER